MKHIIFVALLALALASGATADGAISTGDGSLAVAFAAETGFVKIWSHTVQIGETDDVLNYVTEGGQEILFPFSRFSAEATINNRHSVILLYQPLDVFA